MFGGKMLADHEEGLDETFDSGIRKRRISGVRESEPEEHTRQTSRPPPSATADLLTLTRDDGTIPESLSALLTAEDRATIEEARALYMQSQALQPHEFQELRALLGDALDYGKFDPNAVPVRGMWSDLAEICLEPRAIMLLGLVDGTSTVASIVALSGLSVSEAIAELDVLVDHGAIDV